MHSAQAPSRTPANHCEPKSPVEINCPQIALREVVRSVVSQVSELHRCSVCARHHNTTALFSRLRNSTVRTSTSQRSHLLSCEHSWAEQTTGPRTMRLRVRIHTIEKKPCHITLKSRQQGQVSTFRDSAYHRVTAPQSSHQPIDTTPEAEGHVLTNGHQLSVARCMVNTWHRIRET